MSDDRAVETTIKIRKEIEKMLSIAREVETEVKANPQAQEISRRDEIELVAKREQLEDVRELLVEAEDRLRDD